MAIKAVEAGTNNAVEIRTTTPRETGRYGNHYDVHRGQYPRDKQPTMWEVKVHDSRGHHRWARVYLNVDANVAYWGGDWYRRHPLAISGDTDESVRAIQAEVARVRGRVGKQRVIE